MGCGRGWGVNTTFKASWYGSITSHHITSHTSHHITLHIGRRSSRNLAHPPGQTGPSDEAIKRQAEMEDAVKKWRAAQSQFFAQKTDKLALEAAEKEASANAALKEAAAAKAASTTALFADDATTCRR